MDHSTFDDGEKRSADDRQRRRRLAFDLFFGVTVPLGHMTFERDLFLSADEDGTGFYGVEVLPVYVFCGAAIAVLITWLTTRRYALVLVGPLLVSAFGLLLLAILWTFLGLGKIASGDPTGIFGVLAPLTIAVFLRSAIEADRTVRRTTSWPVLASVGVVSAALMGALPYAAVRAAEASARSAVEASCAVDVATSEEGVTELERLRDSALLRPYASGALVSRIEAEPDPERRLRLQSIERRVFGSDDEPPPSAGSD